MGGHRAALQCLGAQGTNVIARDRNGRTHSVRESDF